MSRAWVVAALVLAGVVGGVALFAIGGSRRLSHRASHALTWLAPAFFVSCCVVAGAVRTGKVAEIAVGTAWSTVGVIVLGFYGAKLFGRPPQQPPPSGSSRE